MYEMTEANCSSRLLEEGGHRAVIFSQAYVQNSNSPWPAVKVLICHELRSGEAAALPKSQEGA